MAIAMRERAPLLACFLSWAAPAGAQQLCPQGPFETDHDKIVAVLAKAPVPPVTLGTDVRSSTPPENWHVSNGVTRFSAGGLDTSIWDDESRIITSYSGIYDADRYVSRSVIKEENFNSKKGRVVDTSYLITTTRPTPEQAKDIACLANQLLNPPVSLHEPVAPTPVDRTEPGSPPELVVTGRRMRRCEAQYTDAHVESTNLVVGAAAASASRDLSCGTQLDLELRLGRAVDAPYDDAWREKQQANAETHTGHGRLRRAVDFILRPFGLGSSR
jgi:hypothetical protein